MNERMMKEPAMLDVHLRLQHILFPEREWMAHPFLKALRCTRYGSLTVVTPGGITREFLGAEPGPAAHLQVNDWRALDKFIAHGEMGFVESYIARQWDSKNLTTMLTFGLLNTDALEQFFYGNPWQVWATRLADFFSRNSMAGSRRNIAAHYDLGNEFYRLWLDSGMTYSCGLFENDPLRTLEEAQAAKYQRVLTQLNASEGEHILEIGCGWGAFMEYAARQGMRVTGITISKEQARYAAERLDRAGLGHLARVKIMDYREISETFDHVVSIGMLEHVGEQYWPVYFQTIQECLNPGGRALVQSITLRDDLFERLQGRQGFMEQIIFPGGMLPSVTRFLREASEAQLECRNIYPFGGDYVHTLGHWLERFNRRIQEVQALGYDESFERLWKFYLSGSIAAFASGRTSVMQATLTHAE